MPTTISGTTGVSQVQDGVITAPKIVDSAVIQEKIANNAVITRTIGAGVVNNEKIANNSITSAQLSAGAINIPFMHLIRSTEVTFNANTFTDIPYSSVVKSRNITFTGTSDISFQIPGCYIAHIGFRMGTGSDVWSGFRLIDFQDNTVYGVSYGFGQINTNDPTGLHTALFFEIPSNKINRNTRIQIYRATSGLTVITPAFPSTAYFPAITTTIQYLG